MSLSPRQHPNAYATATAGGLTTFLVAEAKLRLGIDVTLEEAGWIIVAVTTAVHFCSKWLGGKDAKEDK